jgi:hypothetical protein
MQQNLVETLESTAETDPAFRQRLLDDPRAAIAAATGAQLPADLPVNAREEGGRVRIEFPETASVALSDDDLENVAGAGCPYCMWTKGTYCFFTK